MNDKGRASRIAIRVNDLLNQMEEEGLGVLESISIFHAAVEACIYRTGWDRDMFWGGFVSILEYNHTDDPFELGGSTKCLN